jgi:hypothetical protein
MNINAWNRDLYINAEVANSRPSPLAFEGPEEPLIGGNVIYPPEFADEPEQYEAPTANNTKPIFSKFPAELTALPNWVMWRYVQKQGKKKPDKVPFQPIGGFAKTNDSSTWATFEACCGAYNRGGFDGIGSVFDGKVGDDGLCYVGVDFDRCIIDGALAEPARTRIAALQTYTEISVSGTGIHVIVKAKPGTTTKHTSTDEGHSIEIYSGGRFFTFTGALLGDANDAIRSAAAEVDALVSEVSAKVGAGPKKAANEDLYVNAELAQQGPAARSMRVETETIGEGIRDNWFETLSPEQKDEVIDHALKVIATNTKLLELGENGGNNDEYYKITTSVARSGAPNAENIFVKYASRAKGADQDDVLRQHFVRCKASENKGITVGTLLGLALQHGADFTKWRRQTPHVPELPPIAWSADELQVSFCNIPHRHWLYGTYIIRGEITVLAAPGGAGKTALATGIAVEIAAGVAKLGDALGR